MGNSFPTNFNSLQEYNAYKRCFNKIKPLDGIELYVQPLNNSNSRFFVSDITANNRELFIVLGRHKNYKNKLKSHNFSLILLGTNNSNMGFWPIYDNIQKELEQYPDMLKYISNHKYGYWISANDSKIAKLFKKER